MFQKILVATDLSESSSAALAAAVSLAQKYGGSLVLLHVLEAVYESKQWFLPDSVDVEAVRSIVAQEEQIVRARLDELSAGLGLADVVVRVQHGRPGEDIPDVAAEIGADLIVVGTHGHRRLKRVVMGSVAERVARTAGRPVLVVPIARAE